MENPTNRFTPAAFIRVLSILHMGFMASPVALGGVFYFITKETYFSFDYSDDIYLAVVPTIALVGFFMGDIVFRKLIGSIPQSLGLKEKMQRFQTASIIKYAMLEAAVLFGVVTFFTTKNLAFLLISAILLLYFALQRPTKDRIENILNLRGEEKAQFNRLNQPLE